MDKKIISIIIFVVLVGVYIDGVILLNNAKLPIVDLTDNKIHIISEESKDKISKIENETKIYSYGFSDSSYPTLKVLKNFAEQYSDLNSNISYEVVKKASDYPDLGTKYGITDDVKVPLIVVEQGVNSKVLEQNDLASYNFFEYASIDTVEEALTNAIIDVNRSRKFKVCTVETHAIYTGYYNMAYSYISNCGCDVNSLEISINSVPDDTDLVIIASPKEDWTQEEVDRIKEYINKGGNIIILGDCNPLGEATPIFDSLVKEYGVTIDQGIVGETEMTKTIDAYSAYYIVPIVTNESTITKDFSDSVTFFNSAKLKVDEGIEHQTLVTTSETSFFRRNLELTDANKTDEDEDCKFEPLVVKTSKKINDETTSNAVIFANSVFASYVQIPYGQDQSNQITPFFNFLSNRKILINSISELVGRNDVISIPKRIGSVAVGKNTDDGQKVTIKVIIFAVPVVIILIGAIVFILRRRKL